MKNTLAFLVGWLIAAVLMVPQAKAAVSLTPTVPGYSAGMFSSPSGGFSMTPANDGFIKPATASVGGKPITVPAKMRMASNAGQFVKDAMRLNPWAIAGTLAAGWLFSEGMEWLNGQWQKKRPDNGPVPGRTWRHGFGSEPTCLLGSNVDCTWDEARDRLKTSFQQVQAGVTEAQWGACTGTTSVTCTLNYKQSGNPTSRSFAFYGNNPLANPYQPATQPDWDALPDPLPALAPELPFAPYMPEGVPVEKPEYDFAPFAVPTGAPYERPDGSTAQPMAKVNPDGDRIRVDTYDQPLTDPQGNPVSGNDAAPQPTPAPQEDPKTDCDKYPNALGCIDTGVPPAGEAMPKTEVPLTFSPVSVSSNPSCPAPIGVNAFGRSFSIDYSGPCTYASGLKPIVIAVAYLTAALIIFGVPRSTQT